SRCRSAVSSSIGPAGRISPGRGHVCSRSAFGAGTGGVLEASRAKMSQSGSSVISGVSQHSNKLVKSAAVPALVESREMLVDASEDGLVSGDDRRTLQVHRGS